MFGNDTFGNGADTTALDAESFGWTELDVGFWTSAHTSVRLYPADYQLPKDFTSLILHGLLSWVSSTIVCIQIGMEW